MSFNIQTVNGLKEISGKVTKDKVVKALGYSPANEDDLIDNIAEDESGELTIADENGSVIMRVNEDGISTTNVNTDTINLNNLIDKETESFEIADNNGNVIAQIDANGIKTTDMEVDTIRLYNMNGVDSEKLEVADEDGNVVFRVDADGLHTTNVTIDNQYNLKDINNRVEALENKTASTNLVVEAQSGKDADGNGIVTLIDSTFEEMEAAANAGRMIILKFGIFFANMTFHADGVIIFKTEVEGTLSAQIEFTSANGTVGTVYDRIIFDSEKNAEKEGKVMTYEDGSAVWKTPTGFKDFKNELGEAITWDGSETYEDGTPRESVALDGTETTFYYATDAGYSYAHVCRGASFYSNGVTFAPTEPFYAANDIVVYAYQGTGTSTLYLGAIALVDNAVYEGATFPKKGVYFAKTNSVFFGTFQPSINTITAVVPSENVQMKNKKNLEETLAGCWVAFEDENGNPTDEPYIHWYAEEVEIGPTVLAETAFDFTLDPDFGSYGLYSSVLPLSDGDLTIDTEYIVSWDGVEYPCTASAMSISAGEVVLSGVGLGNAAILGIGDNTGEPFLLGIIPSPGFSGVYTALTDATHNVAIYRIL